MSPTERHTSFSSFLSSPYLGGRGEFIILEYYRGESASLPSRPARDSAIEGKKCPPLITLLQNKVKATEASAAAVWRVKEEEEEE